jgi:type IV secretion system protein VirB4
MLSLAEYRDRAARLADYLPWACLVAPGVVLNKDGSFQRTAHYRGPDLDSATPGELVAFCARVNNVLKRFGSGWALTFEAERHPCVDYPSSEWRDPAAWLVDNERRAQFEEADAHFESRFYLTLAWLPPADRIDRAGALFIETPAGERDETGRERLASFLVETDRALDLLAQSLPEAAWLDDPETLTYLHGTISPKRMRVAVPETPAYLDAVLPDAPLAGGLAPRLGDSHLRTLTVRGFPNATEPGLLDDLNRLGLGYRWVTRFLPLDKADATRILTGYRRRWFAKRKSIMALLKEVMTNEASVLVDTDADNKAADADTALQELGADDVAFGYLTTTVTVMDEDARAADEALRAVERAINGHSFVTIRETVNAVEAWLGSLPGHAYANVRQPIVHTLNLAHLTPLSAVWAGPERNAHLEARRCSRRPRTAPRRFASSPTRATSATPSSSAPPARASRCCWRCSVFSSGATRTPRCSCSTREDRRAPSRLRSAASTTTSVWARASSPSPGLTARARPPGRSTGSRGCSPTKASRSPRK